jgi:thiamine monophosphate synthase
LIELGVNIDHVATLREARKTYEPDPVWAAVEAHLGGADGITVHQEACVHLQRTIMAIKGRGKQAGVSLNPGTSEETLRYVAGDVDLVLVMSVNPGFGGQKFLVSQLDKVRRIRAMLDAAGNTAAIIEIDCGIDPDNAAAACEAGVTALVAGSAVFGKSDRRAAIAALRAAADDGAARHLAAGEGDAAYWRTKIGLARIYSEHILAQAPGLTAAVTQGSADLFNITAESMGA